MYEVARTLRPGGVFITGCGSVQLYDENLAPVPALEPGTPGASWLQWAVSRVYIAYLNNKNWMVNGYLYWKKWAEINPNYKESYVEDYYIPLGPWKENMSEREVLASNLMREGMARIVPAFKQGLLADGHSEADIDLWTKEALEELREMKFRHHVRWPFTAAVRGDNPWQPRKERFDPPGLYERSLIPSLLKQSTGPAQTRSVISL